MFNFSCWCSAVLCHTFILAELWAPVTTPPSVNSVKRHHEAYAPVGLRWVSPSLASQLEFDLSGPSSFMLSFVSLPFIQGFRYSGLLVERPGFTASGDWFTPGSVPTVSWVGFADFRGGHRVDQSANILCYGCIARMLPHLLTLSCLLSRVYQVIGQLVLSGDGGSAARRRQSKTGELTEGQSQAHPLWGGGRYGSTFLDIPGLVWDIQLGIAQNGLFPVGSRLSFFLPAWQRIASD